MPLLVLPSAILLILSFPKTNLEFLAWFAFVPLFFTIQDKKPIYGFLLSYIYGLIFFAGTIYWLINVTFVGFVILILYLALYLGIFGLIITRYSILDSRYSILFISAIWVLLEYLRSHLFTGFGWGLLAYSQYLNLPIIQIVNITGVWGVSFLVMMVNVLIYSIFGNLYSIFAKKRKSTLSIVYCTISVLLLFLSLGYGFYKLHRASSIEHRTPFEISVIQGNIPQKLKWSPVSEDYIIDKYLNISRQVAKDGPDLIIWPEAALPVVLEQEPAFFEQVKTLAQDIKIPLLLGAVTVRENLYYNSALLLSEKGRLLNRYDKLHLVPFGEYVPFKRIFGFLETFVPIGDFTAGEEYTVFQYEAGSRNQEAGNRKQEAIHFSVLICFEDIFPELSRWFVKKGANFLVNITNDAWFGDTASPYQHLSASVFRSVENGVYLVRAANTGISGFITPQGRVSPLIDNESGKQTFVSGYNTSNILDNFKQESFYTQWGDWFVMVCLLFAIYTIIRIVKEPSESVSN